VGILALQGARRIDISRVIGEGRAEGQPLGRSQASVDLLSNVVAIDQPVDRLPDLGIPEGVQATIFEIQHRVEGQLHVGAPSQVVGQLGVAAHGLEQLGVRDRLGEEVDLAGLKLLDSCLLRGDRGEDDLSG
jgi:hypothetical protein